MTPFDLIDTDRWQGAPFFVPCPYCDAPSTYITDKSKFICTHSSYIEAQLSGMPEEESLCGTVLGECKCSNRDCQEHVHFVGAWSNDLADEGNSYHKKFKINSFFPAVPLIPIPPATPYKVKALLRRSFAPAFFDQSASGNLLRSAIEALLTEIGIPRFMGRNGRGPRINLHQRIERLPNELNEYKDSLLAAKWIGNAASHDDLTVNSLRIGYEIVKDFLEELYGTRKRDMAREIKRINRRKKP